MNKKAYTLIELMVVIMIVLIIAAAAITGSAGLMKSLRVGNTFNKIVFTVQRARNLASTGKNQAAYGVFFENSPDPTASDKVTIFTDRNGNEQYDSGPVSAELIELITINPSDASLTMSDKTSGDLECVNSGLILYKENSGEAILRCGGDLANKTLMEFGIVSEDVERTFLIHRVAGVPQAG